MAEVVTSYKFDGFLRKYFGNSNYRVVPLAGDASTRRYFRIVLAHQSWVLMVWDAFDPEHYPFLSVQKHFKKNGARVPEVIELSPFEGFILLEDLGDLTLERKFWEIQDQVHALPFYQKALDQLLSIHFKASLDKSNCTAFDIQFDTEKFLWEMKYGYDNLLEGICELRMSEAAKAELFKAFTSICLRLDQQPKWIAHRDYHSRNVMLKFDEICVIDFQDARMGPIQYDLVSLLKDSYVQLNEETAQVLLDYYLDKAKPFLGKEFSQENFDLIYEVQSIQRCFKACGSFSSFYKQRGDTRYLKYISHTLKRVLKSLGHFPEYKVFADALIDSGSIERQYEQL